MAVASPCAAQSPNCKIMLGTTLIEFAPTAPNTSNLVAITIAVSGYFILRPWGSIVANAAK
jgi:hypothetical protein